MLPIILIVIAVIVVGFVVLVSRRSAAYQVERTLDVAAPPERVFGTLEDLRRFAGVLFLFGSPWEAQDPHMERTFSGAPSGVGQSFAWRGKKVGQGTMTIEDAVRDRRLNIKLEFVKPMASTTMCVLTVAPTAAGSSVSWSMAGNHNFLGKAFGVFIDMDKMLGRDIAMGLAQLKTTVEASA